jgi:hypothetical protein
MPLSSLVTVARELWRPSASHRTPLVVLIIDGLGANVLERFAAAMPRLSSAWHEAGRQVARSCFPSTTVTCLPTIGRATPPSVHGLVGYSFRVEAQRVIWPSHLEDGDRPLALGGVHPASRRRAAYLTIGPVRSDYLSRQAFPHATRHALDSSTSANERILGLLGDHDLVFLYLPDPDAAAHRHGLGSRVHVDALIRADLLYGSLAGRRDPFALMVLADHGMVPVDRWFSLERFVSGDDLAVVAGEARAVHLYARDGRADWLREACLAIPGATVMARDDIDAHGLLGGHLHPRVAGRVGDVVVTFAHPGVGITWRDGPGQLGAPAQHGGLSDAEMLVPYFTLL